MAKKKTRKKSSKRAVSRSGSGSYCITSTAPRSGSKANPNGLKFTTVCYKTARQQTDAVIRMTQRGDATVGRGTKYSVMIYKRKGG